MIGSQATTRVNRLTNRSTQPEISSHVHLKGSCRVKRIFAYSPGRLVAKLSPSRRGVLSIFGGTAGGQLLALVSAPVLSRLYSPSDFGVFTLTSSFVAVIGTIAALRFELAVPLPESERDARGLVALGLISTGATFVFTSAVVWLAGGRLALVFDQPHLMPWLWCVPATSALVGVYLLLNQLAIRHRRYRAIGRRNLLQSVALVATQVGAGAAGLRSGGLILGLAVAQLTSALSLLRGSGLRTPDSEASHRLATLQHLARRYRHFPLLLAPSGLLNVMGLQLPVVLIAYWYGSSVAGWVGLTQRVLSLPVMLLGSAIAQVYLAELARAARHDFARARQLFSTASRRLLAIALPLGLALVLLARFLFERVFGDQWLTSGRYAQALAPSLVAQLVATPVSQTLIVFGRQRAQLCWDAARLLVILAAVSICHLAQASAQTTISTFGIVSAAAYCVSWALSFHAITHAGDRTLLA